MVGGSHVEVVDELEDFLERILGAVLRGLHFVHFAHEEVLEGHGVDILVESCGYGSDFLDFLVFGADVVQEVTDEGGFACSYGACKTDASVAQLVEFH